MRIALAQINPTIGDLHENCALVELAAQNSQDADLVVAPELVISGYPPRDLLLRGNFVEMCDTAVANLARRHANGPAILVGHPTRWNVPDARIANAASLLADGQVVATVHKSLLPNYDVFDERRYFRRAETVAPIEFRGHKLGVHICEDAWWADDSTFYHHDPTRYADPIETLVQAGVDILINLSASPFQLDKPDHRLGIMREHSKRHGVPFVFVNQVGGNDDLVFDGNSFCLNSQGDVIAHAAGFTEDACVCSFFSEPLPILETTSNCREQQLLDALVLGLRDYIEKCGFRECVLGLSGGIDSALACYIAARAIGPENVHTLLMPSRYSSEHSVTDALKLVHALGVDHETISIDAVHKAFEATEVVGDELLAETAGLAEQNLQARIRGAMVMVRSNRYGWIALATGNKSELAVGYCTLYGDMAGGFGVLADVLKRDVYAVSRHINKIEGREVIPVNIIEKAPSAELAPDQVDQDTLPPYPVLDAILEGLIERDASVNALAQEFPRETVEWVASRLDRNEFKRRQMAPGIKLSNRAFGSGRRMPMAARFLYE